MLESIRLLDEWILLWFQGIHNKILDNVFWYVSEGWIFFPLWGWALYEIFGLYGVKQIWKIIVIVGFTILISDQICNVFKNQVKRLRPTHQQEYKEKIKVVNGYVGGKYGFYSAHASNSAAIGMLTFLLVRRSRVKYWMVIYPLLSGVSRMYLGVHFFTDVLMGWVMGMVIAYFVFLLFQRYLLVKDN
ncbi:MAG: phosphatase PAP2 family protein [Bacteroidia bacterium]|nr:MAG: phosphatase PAP2 family protein [Bacteroidia bacterium]